MLLVGNKDVAYIGKCALYLLFIIKNVSVFIFIHKYRNNLNHCICKIQKKAQIIKIILVQW